ncbi:MAG: Plug domain-containing protein [Acidihalobacter sp.]|uniref:Plug domain-containing protein n=1 Tax=Acidihalobacter sp. TaxID=1872108 RepID=UPI00307DA578
MGVLPMLPVDSLEWSPGFVIMSLFSMETVKKFNFKTLAWAILLALSFEHAYAQETINQKSSSTKEKGETSNKIDVFSLPPVTVTARKIREDIQKVPLSVTEKTGMELEDEHIQNTQALSRWVPDFNFSNSGLPFDNLLNIRGIGSSSALISPSVIYYGRL